MSLARRGIAELFEMQDRSMAANRAAIGVDFELLDDLLSLTIEVTLALQEPEIVAQRQSRPGGFPSDPVRANLLHAAWGSLMSATRLTLFGDHMSALAVVRSAFEATFHAEYFRYEPAAASEYEEATVLKDRRQRARRLRSLSDEALCWLKARDDPEGTRRQFFQELSTLGSHGNVAMAALKFASPTRERANLGFTSQGYDDRTRLCTFRIAHVAHYVLSELVEGYEEYLRAKPDVLSEFDRVTERFHSARRQWPADISLLS